MTDDPRIRVARGLAQHELYEMVRELYDIGASTHSIRLFLSLKAHLFYFQDCSKSYNNGIPLCSPVP